MRHILKTLKAIDIKGNREIFPRQEIKVLFPHLHGLKVWCGTPACHVVLSMDIRRALLGAPGHHGLPAEDMGLETPLASESTQPFLLLSGNMHP